MHTHTRTIKTKIDFDLRSNIWKNNRMRKRVILQCNKTDNNNNKKNDVLSYHEDTSLLG